MFIVYINNVTSIYEQLEKGINYCTPFDQVPGGDPSSIVSRESELYVWVG